MLKIIIPPALAGVELSLQQTFDHSRTKAFLTIQAAKLVAKEIFEQITDEGTKIIFSAPATSRELQSVEYKIMGDDLPELNLLEQLALIGIHQFQHPEGKRVTNSSVSIRKTDAEKAGYTRNKTFFEHYFMRMRQLTGEVIYLSPYSGTPDVHIFTFACRFDFEKKFPWQEKV